MSALRWWLFRRLSELGWWICPEPYKSNLQALMPTWIDIEQARAALAAEDADLDGWKNTATEYAAELHVLRAQLAEARKALAEIRKEASRVRGEQSYRDFARFAARRAALKDNRP